MVSKTSSRTGGDFNRTYQSSNMVQLEKWIKRIQCKRQSCYRSPKRDLRVEAVLAHTLSIAENEFRSQQLQWIDCWHKKIIKRKMEYRSCGLYNKKKEEQDSTKINPWQGTLCPELSSLDDFMLKVNQIKSPIQR